MSSFGIEPQFNRGAVRPVECIKQGWEIVKDRYWLFFGISFVGMLIAGMVPFYLMLGPMMIGIHLAVMRKMRREPVAFEVLFKGFDSFGPALVASLFFIVPMVVTIVGVYITFIFGAILAGGAGSEAAGVVVLILGALLLLGAMLASIVWSIACTFAFPLLAERKMSGVDAIKLSARAAFANFGGLLGLMMLNVLMMLVGSLAFCIGGYFLLPIYHAALTVAYRQVFPEANPQFQPFDPSQQASPYGAPSFRPPYF